MCGEENIRIPADGERDDENRALSADADEFASKSKELRFYRKIGIIMKVRASVKRRCEYCQVVKRNGIVRVLCTRDPRHKQRQG